MNKPPHTPTTQRPTTQTPKTQSSEAMNHVGTQLQLRPYGRPSRKTRPRLSDGAYTGRRTYHVTLTTNRHLAVFADLEQGRQCVDLLEDAAAKASFNLMAFCFMPDHVHLLAQGQTDRSSLIGFLQRFKQSTSFAFKREMGRSLWQQSFFDRVLRKTDEADAVADYILDYPRQDGFQTDHPAFVLRGGACHERRVADGAEAASVHGSSLCSIDEGTRPTPPESRGTSHD